MAFAFSRTHGILGMNSKVISILSGPVQKWPLRTLEPLAWATSMGLTVKLQGGGGIVLSARWLRRSKLRREA